MNASLFYKIASILLVLFAIGHTLGFRQTDPKWGIEGLVSSMQSIHFDVQGFNRTYWDFFVGLGLIVSVLLLFAAALAWQLGSLPARTLSAMRVPAWTLAICFAAVTALTWRYFFTAPLVFAIPVTACLVAAAWLIPKQTPG